MSEPAVDYTKLEGEMTKNQRRVMYPYVDAIDRLAKAIHELPEQALDELDSAARAHTQTNCWFRAYDAAQLVIELVSDERAYRKNSPRHD